MSKQQPSFICAYRDGTKRFGNYLETLTWFNEAEKTENPCSIRLAYTGYTAP